MDFKVQRANKHPSEKPKSKNSLKEQNNSTCTEIAILHIQVHVLHCIAVESIAQCSIKNANKCYYTGTCIHSIYLCAIMPTECAQISFCFTFQ